MIILRRPHLILTSLTLASLTLTACGPKAPSPTAAGSAALKARVSAIGQGALIDQMNQAQVESQAAPKGKLKPKKAPKGAKRIADEIVDPCGGVATSGETASIVAGFAQCLRDELDPAHQVEAAIEYFKVFNTAPGQKAFSEMTDAELKDFLKANAGSPEDNFGGVNPRADLIRQAYTDADLAELLKLVTRRHDALKAYEAKVYAAVDARRAVIEEEAKNIDRYAMLLALRDTATDETGADTGAKLAEIAAKSGMDTPADLSGFPVDMLHPYALEAVVPDEKMDTAALDVDNENPFKAVLTVCAELGGPIEITAKALVDYKAARDNDNPAIPDHDAPAADAVKVAFIDTGVDFIKYPDLALFLGTGQDGQIASHDYADNDENPYIPAIGMMEHGSGTSASLLTIMAHYAPETLTERKLDLAMWKVETARQLLSGPVTGLVEWDSRYSLQEAIVKRVTDDSLVKPKIVSVSMGFPIEPFLEKAGARGAIAKSPWLWVMAAGNSGIDVHEEKMHTCMDDVPKAEREDKRILCVGALVQGIVNDKVASYSNFGDRVDVYAYESYIGICPNGTSCATPAVSGAVAIIAAKFPSLTPEQLKEVIVEAAEPRHLAVDIDVNDPQTKLLIELGAVQKERDVKVFNPTTMLGKALEIAAAKAAPAPQPSAAPIAGTN